MTKLPDGQSDSTVAALLKRWKTERGISERKLAEAAGLKHSSLNHWIKGEVKHPYHVGLLKVAAALKLSRTETNELLRAGEARTIDQLARSRNPDILTLIAPWQSTAPNNLPAELTSFVGRKDEIRRITQLLDRDDPPLRLITLTGAGGSGKTRLALRVAGELFGRFPDGVYAVMLAAIDDPRLVIQTIAETVGLRDVTDAALPSRLAGWLASRRVLLVLDNLEHLLDAGPALAKLLQDAGQAKILVTSRTPLHLSGEQLWPVTPLPLPDMTRRTRRLRTNPAVDLFLQRAQAANPHRMLEYDDDLATIAEICARLDGLPLAIELAAARTREHSPNWLLASIPNRLDLTEDGPRDAPDRQRTLRATIAWSLDLLSEQARALLPRLAVFAGGWTTEAAAEVCLSEDAEPLEPLLETLAEANLIEPVEADTESPRFRMLETIREYGLEMLAESGEVAELRDRHAAYFLALAESAPPYVPEARQGGWHERVDADIDNLRAALTWAEANDDFELLSRLDAALWTYWYEHQRMAEGRRWFQRVLPRVDELPLERRASILLGAGYLVASLSEYEEMERYAGEALGIYERMDDSRWRAVANRQLGWSRLMRNQPEGITAAFQAELQEWKRIADQAGVAAALNDLATSATIYGDFTTALRYIAQEEEQCRGLSEQLIIARTRRNQGLLALLIGDIARAIPLLNEAVACWRLTGSYQFCATTFYLGTAYCFAGQLDAAITAYDEALAIAEAEQDQVHLALVLLGFAAVAYRQGAPERAAKLCGASQTIRDDHKILLPPAAEQLYQHEVGVVHSLIDNNDFDHAFKLGRNMTTRQALAYAREVIPASDPS